MKRVKRELEVQVQTNLDSCIQTVFNGLLWDACANLDEQEVIRCFALKADPNSLHPDENNYYSLPAGDTLLHAFVRSSQQIGVLNPELAIKIAGLLVENGADLTALNAQNQTPLERAMYENKPAFIELLIESGADPRPYTSDLLTGAASGRLTIGILGDISYEVNCGPSLMKVLTTISVEQIKPMFLLQCIFRLKWTDSTGKCVPKDVRQIIIRTIEQEIIREKYIYAQSLIGSVESDLVAKGYKFNKAFYDEVKLDQVLIGLNQSMNKMRKTIKTYN